MPPSSSYLDRMKPLAAEWLRIAVPLIAVLYLVELITNRIIFRVVIFIPPGPVQDAFGSIIAFIGTVSINLLTLASLAMLVAAIPLMGRWAYIPALIILAYFLDLAGLVKAAWILPLLAAYLLLVSPWRITESLALTAMTVNSFVVSPALAWLANLLWLAAPLGPLAARLKGSLPARPGKKLWITAVVFTALSLLMVVHNSYIAGQILVFAMGLLSPWLLPPAIPLYAATGSLGSLGLLMTGPGLQLSMQILVLASLYIGEALLQAGGVRAG